MIETIVAVVGAFSTLAGVGIGVAGYRSQAALVRLQGEQLRRQIEDSERAQRSAESAERRAEAAEHRAREAERRAEQAARQRTEQEERAERWRERQQLLVHARGFTVEAAGQAVRVAYRGAHPVTEVRLYWRGTEITPGGRGLDLYAAPGAPSAAEATASVPGMPEGDPVQLADILAEFTDIHRRRWRRRGDGTLLLRDTDGQWSSEPTAWLDDVPALPRPAWLDDVPALPHPAWPPTPTPQGTPWGRPQVGDPMPQVRPYPAAAPYPAGPKPLLEHDAPRPRDVRSARWWRPVLSLAGIGIGVACLLLLAF
ncbi:hypothetical protein ACIA8O_25770 [Kitasatospora sp. NPDC051853]|uniref:hypothetical protein n=1 Tax=Kitasatospora sp. NPDC051853 TaxID=3364058 RepID=UPI00379563F5